MVKPKAVPTQPLDPIGTVTYPQLLPTFDKIIEWATEAVSPIGYFAVIYRQATVAIRDAIKHGEFEDPNRMREFQRIFAQRYFAALDAYNDNDKPFTPHSLVWVRCFDGNGRENPMPIIFQHLLTSLNAHMNLDLGAAAAITAKAHGIPIGEIRDDFDVVNGVLGNQVEAVLVAMDDISPVIKWLRRLAPCEVELFKGLIVVFREIAWAFALKCAAADDIEREISLHDAKYTLLGTSYIYSPDAVTPLVEKIASKESRDVPRNIRVLNRIAKPSWQSITDYRRDLDKLVDN